MKDKLFLKDLTLKPQTLMRMAVDVSIINFSILFCLSLRFILVFKYSQNLSNQADIISLLNLSINSFLNNVLICTLVSLITFSIAGFYSFGKMYINRRNLLIVISVTIVYILIYFINYILLDVMAVLSFGIVVMSCLISMLLVIASRYWSQFWRWNYKKEEKILKYYDIHYKNILVIGGAGYIGSALLPKLLQHGYNVKILDSFVFGHDAIKNYMDHPNLNIIEGDFRHVDKVVDAMQDMDIVVHLGGLVGDPACSLNEELTMEVNLLSTQMIIEAAKAINVKRFIFASTCSVYGASINEEFLNEESLLNPVSLYAQTKIASENLTRKLDDDGLSPIILRFGTIYGFSGRVRFDLVVNLLTATAMVDGRINIFGGKQWRPFVHVDDAANAIIACIKAPLSVVKNQTFNVGSTEQNYRVEEIGKIIHSILPNAEIINLGDDKDIRNYKVSFDKIRKELNFHPQWTIEDGVKQIIQAFREGKIDDYRMAKYSNYKFMLEENDSDFTKLVYHYDKEAILKDR